MSPALAGRFFAIEPPGKPFPFLHVYLSGLSCGMQDLNCHARAYLQL